MLKHKNIDRICCWVLVITLLVTCGCIGAGAAGLIAPGRTMGYEQRLFDTGRVHTLDIVMEDWEGFLSTCTNEEYTACHVVIDGESCRNVAIRAKGNTSLSSVEQYGNHRYSFKIEFDHYQPGSTYHGLDKLSLNNLIQDNTYLKDYFAYTLMRKGGAAAPLCSFVQISVNGEPWGLYLAVEGVEDSFLQRNFGSDTGELYKPDSMSFGGGRGNGRGFDMEDFRKKLEQEDAGESDAQGTAGLPMGMTPPEGSNAPTGMTPPEGSNAPMGMTPPEGSNAPMGMTPPEGSNAPMGMTPPEGSNAPMGMTPPEGSNAPMGMTPPEGSNAPMGMTPPEGSNAPMGMTPPEGNTAPDAAPASAPNGFTPPDWGGSRSGRGGMGSRGSADVMLQYIDEDPASYSNIFDNAKTDVSEADQQRLIGSLKALSEGDASVVDQEAVLRYLAVHNFLCNDDSYTGSMVHNYYLYEKDGLLSMLPWDYNLAFGGFGMGGGSGASGATGTVNQAIDSPVTGGELSSRPMAAWVFADEQTIARYHEVYRQFIDEAFTGGWFVQEIDRVSELVSPYVEDDPTAFCTFDEFQTGVAALRAFCLLRAESVQGQLDGSIPSTEDGQRSSDALVDASHLNLSDMGSMGKMGGGPGGFGGEGRQGFGGRMQPGGNGSRREQSGSAAQTGAADPDSSRPAADPAAEAEQPSPQSLSAQPVSPTGAGGGSLPLLLGCLLLLATAIFLVSRYRTNL